MSEIDKFTSPMPQEDAESIQLEASRIPPAEATKVEAVATLISQTITSMYGTFIPQETKEVNFAIGKRVIVTDDLTTFEKAWDPRSTESLPPNDVNGISFQFGGIIAILNPEIDWGRCCPHCKARDVEAFGSDAAKERYKGRYYTTFLAHEETHQYQDHSLPREFLETGAYYYTSVITRSLGHNPMGDDLAGRRYDAYEAWIKKYGDDVHRVFFGSVNTPITKLKKPLILREAQRQKEALFPNGQDL